MTTATWPGVGPATPGGAWPRLAAALGQGQGGEAVDLGVALGDPLGADALADALDLLLVDAEAAVFGQVQAPLAEGRLVGGGVGGEVEHGGAVRAQVDAQAFGLGEEGLAAPGAIALGLQPGDLPGARGEGSGLGVVRVGGAAARGARAGPVGGREGSGLASQGQVEELFLDEAAQGQGGPLQGGEGGAPSRARGPE